MVASVKFGRRTWLIEPRRGADEGELGLAAEAAEGGELTMERW